MRDDDTQLREAELGYRTAGARELSMRDWLALRGDPDEPAPTPRDFAALINRLNVKRWVKANPEKRRAIANRYARKPEVVARAVKLQRQRRLEKHRAAPPVTCSECGVQFCSVKVTKGNPRRFCTTKCMQRAAYQRKTPGARRIKRTGLQP